MSEPVIPQKAKLFIGILYNSDSDLLLAEKHIIKKFGEIDYQTSPITFSHTNYYESIGKNLYKVFYSFKKLIKREDIVTIKLFTNKLEKKISGKDKRTINIDPGYLTLSNVYLATCKEFFHRAYLTKGVYLENELLYTAKHYQTWDWTYPDYKKMEYLDFFYTIRKMYHKQIK